jgi:hypothetical protein
VTAISAVGRHRIVPGLLLLLGNVNRSAASASQRPARVPLTAWVRGDSPKTGLDKASVVAAPGAGGRLPDRAGHRPAPFRAAAGGISGWRPMCALATALVLISVALLASPAALADAPGLGTTTAAVALHEAPGGDAPVLAELSAGTEVELTGAAEGEFLEVTSGGLLGWMRVDSLDGEIDTALVVVDASLRAAPNDDGAILGAVQAGRTVILTGASVDGYLAASFGGTGGWLPAHAVA